MSRRVVGGGVAVAAALLCSGCVALPFVLGGDEQSDEEAMRSAIADVDELTDLTATAIGDALPEAGWRNLSSRIIGCFALLEDSAEYGAEGFVEGLDASTEEVAEVWERAGLDVSVADSEDAESGTVREGDLETTLGEATATYSVGGSPAGAGRLEVVSDCMPLEKLDQVELNDEVERPDIEGELDLPAGYRGG